MSLLYKKLNVLFAFFAFTLNSVAQKNMPEEGNSNIEVVFGVVLIILLGLVAYLFYIDRKVGKTEERIKEIEKT